MLKKTSVSNKSRQGQGDPLSAKQRPRTATVNEDSNIDFENYLLAYSKKVESDIRQIMASSSDPTTKTKEIRTLQSRLFSSLNLPTPVLETLIFIERQYEEIFKSTVSVQKNLKSKID